MKLLEKMEKITEVFFAIALLYWLRNLFYVKCRMRTPSDLREGVVLIKPPLIIRMLAGVPVLNRNFGNGAVVFEVFWGQYFAIMLAALNLIARVDSNLSSLWINSEDGVIYFHLIIFLMALLLSGIIAFVMRKLYYYKRL